MKIALSQRILIHNNRSHDSIEHNWYWFLKNHDIVTVSNIPDQDYDLLSDSVDCFIITGGDDNLVRRVTEIRLATQMIQKNKPVIGICHGCFLLVTLLGGEIEEIDFHYDTVHNVTYFDKIFSVNSFHNLGIKTLHKSATALVNDLDGRCEAWIDGNTAGVVWHPERMTTPWIPQEIAVLFAK